MYKKTGIGIDIGMDIASGDMAVSFKIGGPLKGSYRAPLKGLGLT